MKNKFIDITFPISKNLPIWPKSIGYSYKWNLRMPEAENNLSSIEIDNHTGTHIDAPLHFIEGGKAIDELDLNKLIGLAYVAEIRNVRSITANDLEKSGIPESCTRLILKTDNQEYWNRGERYFQEDFCALDLSGAQWIVDRGIDFIGIDYLSIQRFYDGPETHQILLKEEVIIVECLNLKNVESGEYELICLPIKLKGLEGAPVRAVLKIIDYE
jgi:arylformamidase